MPSKKRSKKNSSRTLSSSRSDLITFSSSSTKTNFSRANSDKEPTEESRSFVVASSSSSIKTDRSFDFDEIKTTHSDVTSTDDSFFKMNDHRVAGGQEYVGGLQKLGTVLDLMEEHFQTFNKSLLDLQKKRDHLFFLRNLIKNDKLINQLSAIDRADVELYMQAIDRNLFSVNLFLSQTEHADSLLRINELIDAMISWDELTRSKKYCKEYLKAFQDKKTIKSISNIFEEEIDKSDGKDQTYKALIRTEFEALLTGCTANDRENIRERLLAIMKHLEFQISKNV